jgi:hypothetical protein
MVEPALAANGSDDGGGLLTVKLSRDGGFEANVETGVDTADGVVLLFAALAFTSLLAPFNTFKARFSLGSALTEDVVDVDAPADMELKYPPVGDAETSLAVPVAAARRDTDTSSGLDDPGERR